MEVGEAGRIYTYIYTLSPPAGITAALRWVAMRAILLFY